MTPPFTLSRVLKCRAAFLSLFCGLVVSGASLQAADYYQRFDQKFLSQNWNLVSGSGHTWSTSPAGSPSHTGEFDLSGHYFNNGFTLRTGAEPDAAVFLGNSLTLSGGALSLRRVVEKGVSTVSTLIIEQAGSRVTNDISGTTALHAEMLIVKGPLSIGPQNSASRTVLLTSGRVMGQGDIVTLRPSRAFTTTIGFTDATAYTGSIVHTTGVLSFARSLRSSGALIIDTQGIIDGSAPPTVVLDQDLTFTSVIIAGVALPAGRHSYAELKTSFGQVFSAGDAKGFITVAPGR